MRFTNIQLHHFPSLPSTNAYAKTHFHTFPKGTLTCIVADEQTSGYGTHKRPWLSPTGGLYVTFAFHLHNEPIEHLAQELSSLVAVVLRSLGYRPTLKWPNDILIDGKKVAGIPCETTSKNGDIEVSLGLGLNLTTDAQTLQSVDQPATSLFAESGKRHTPDEILTLLTPKIPTILQPIAKWS